MNHVIFGEIVCKRVPSSRALRKFVEKKLSDWMRHQTVMTFQKGVPFKVVFEREGAGHQVECSILVDSRQGMWAASKIGASPQEALLKCLQNMTPNGFFFQQTLDGIGTTGLIRNI